MIEQLKKLWATPSAEAIALRELEDAKRKLLAKTLRQHNYSLAAVRDAFGPLQLESEKDA